MADNQLDEDLHSRQIAVYGKENMRKLTTSHVLLVGMNGVAAEVGKNIVLASVAKVTVQDTRNVQMTDLASNFCFTEQDIGKNRASVCAPFLRELNPTVTVNCVTGEVTEDLLTSSTVVVCFDVPMEQCVAYNKICRGRGIHFMKADIRGFAGSIFVDNGDNFVVNDTTGEDPKTAIVAQISNGKPGVVICTDDERIDFEDGDQVVFTEVHGMDELNDGVPRKVTVRNPYSFSIEDTSNYKPHTYGGIVTQIKPTKTLKFRSLAECLESPGEFFFDNPMKWQRPTLLHLGFLALDAFQARHNGELPRPANKEDADEIIKTVKDLSAQYKDCALDDVDESVLRKLASGARAQINPMAAFFGALVGQEILKASTGKFHPIYQWFYYDDFECLPSSGELPESEFAPTNTRYDGNIPVFGRTLQEKLNKLNVFLVGAGALGCEFLKNFALLGVGCQGGLVTVTDDDKIERSNLSRQFLFRNHMIGQNKSEAAGSVVKRMNPAFSIKAMQDRVSPQTENIFNDNFWNSLSLVVNALDNVPARMYVDSRCVFYGKALFESGTLGPKCNTQVVLPHITENYGASADPAEKSAPECTLHNFPHNINHCLTWARSEFIGNFETSPMEVSMFLQLGTGYVQKQYESGSKPVDVIDKLNACKSCIITERCTTFEECIGWARRKFEDYFYNRVLQLITIYPEDAVTAAGGRFWSAPKRFPRPITFDSSDPVHMGFIIAAANLRAFSYGIAPPADHRNPAYFRKMLSDVVVPDFTPDTNMKIKVDEKDGNNAEEEVDEDEINRLVGELDGEVRKTSGNIAMAANEFEKDDDTNHHIDFIWAVANLRGRNYDIAEVDKLQAKLIAGKIIPAIATATAMATGLVCMEVIKYLNGEDNIELYRNTFANLALPLISQSEPFAPAKVNSRVSKTVPDPINHPEYVEEEEIQAYPEGHTVWDKIKMETGDITLQDFVDRVKKDLGFTVTAFAFQSGAMIYNNALPGTKANLGKKFSDLLREKGKEQDYSVDRAYFTPVVLLENDNMETVETPPFIVYYK